MARWPLLLHTYLPLRLRPRYRTRPFTVAWATLQRRPVPPQLDAAGSVGSTRVAVWLLRALEVAVGILVLVFVFKVGHVCGQPGGSGRPLLFLRKKRFY